MAGREDYFADLQQIVDRIMMHPDPVHRVNATHQLLIDSRKILVEARGEALHRLLQETTAIEASKVTGLDRGCIGAWVSRWRDRKGIPVPARRRREFAGGMDLSGGLPNPHPRE
jgi:hypothetical protein